MKRIRKLTAKRRSTRDAEVEHDHVHPEPKDMQTT